MICQGCGNAVLDRGCGPICLVCQHTGRTDPAKLREDLYNLYGQEVCETVARGLAVALDAGYAAISPLTGLTEEQEAILRVEEARKSLRYRIGDSSHNREKPNWYEIDAEQAEEDRERNTCGLCCGTGLIMGNHCPACWSEY